MSYQITIKPGNESFTAEKGETILEAALRNGRSFPYGCRNGACGSCKGKIISGKFAYGENPITGINEEDQKSGIALFCQAHPESDLEIEAREVKGAKDIDIRTLPCRVTRIENMNEDVLRLFLKLPKTERLQFLPGQYIDIFMPGGKRRSFSLANAPQHDEMLELHVRYYDGGLFSDYAFHQLKEKALLRFEGPLGTFFLREDTGRPIIMIAGGTGFAPVKSIMEYMLETGIKRPVYFYWGARRKKDLYLDEVAESWAAEHEHIHYVPVLSEPGPDDQWQGKTGLVHEAVLEDFNDLEGYEVYACGPPPMVHAAHDTFVERGMNSEDIFSDSFEFAPK